MEEGRKGGKEEKKKKGMEGVCAEEGETDVEEEEKQKRDGRSLCRRNKKGENEMWKKR